MNDRRRYLSGLVALSCAAALVAGACGGAQFSGDGGADSGGSAGQGSGGTAGTTAAGGSSTGGTSQACSGVDECDDGDACTVDTCERGACRNDALVCEGGLTCCEGTCGECCADEDCVDDVGCSNDVCFLNVCAHLADDGQCLASEYCDTVSDCTERQACPNGSSEECDDQNPCTTDSCQSGLCYHDGCAEGLNCCEGEGCFTCCGDAQCQNQDTNRCTDNTCLDHKCEALPHCPDDTKCCATETGASCGQCCTANDCDDHVDCTHDSCSTTDGCKNIPEDSLCGAGQVCNPEQGCVTTSNCDDCAVGQVCCNGKCQQCCTPEDCGSIIALDLAIIPPPIGTCTLSKCVDGVCIDTAQTCGFEEACCTPYGCQAFGCTQ